MELESVWSIRQSVRRYTEEPVGEEAIASLIRAAEAAPIGKHNYEGYELAVITDKTILDAIRQEYQEASGNGGNPNNPLFGAPLLFIILGNAHTLDFLEGRDAGILAENIHLEAAALGLGSVIIYSFVRILGRKPRYASLLGLRDDQYPLLSVAVGHPASVLHPRKQKPWMSVIRK